MKIGLSDLPKRYKQNPLLKGIPDELKDVKRYLEVEKSLSLILLTSHKHKTPSSYAKCVECMDKFKQRSAELKRLGFKSFGQFMEYRKVMSVIINNGVEI